MKSIDISELASAIGEETSAWHEYNLDRAAEILSRYSKEQWEILENQVINRPFYWQERLAETLGIVGSKKSAQILAQLLKSTDFQVASIAASELDDMEISLPDDFFPILHELEIKLAETISPRREDVARLIGRLAIAKTGMPKN